MINNIMCGYCKEVLTKENFSYSKGIKVCNDCVIESRTTVQDHKQRANVVKVDGKPISYIYKELAYKPLRKVFSVFKKINKSIIYIGKFPNVEEAFAVWNWFNLRR